MDGDIAPLPDVVAAAEEHGAIIMVDDAHAFVGFDAYQKVIQSVDVVLIACTSHFHPVFFKAAVDAGKHVFSEKPVAVDPTGVRIAMAAGEEARSAFRAQADRMVAELDLVRRDEFEALKAEIAALRAELASLKAQAPAQD